MTPLLPSIADAPARTLMRWRTATTILACSLASMTIAVTVMAWQVTRLSRERHRARIVTTHALASAHWPSPHEVRTMVEGQCAAFEHRRSTHAGLYGRAALLPSALPPIAAVRAGIERDCAVVADMRRTGTGFYAP